MISRDIAKGSTEKEKATSGDSEKGSTEGEKATSGDIAKGITEGEKVKSGDSAKRSKTPSKCKQPTKKGWIAQKKHVSHCDFMKPQEEKRGLAMMKPASTLSLRQYGSGSSPQRLHCSQQSADAPTCTSMPSLPRGRPLPCTTCSCISGTW